MTELTPVETTVPADVITMLEKMVGGDFSEDPTPEDPKANPIAGMSPHQLVMARQLCRNTKIININDNDLNNPTECIKHRWGHDLSVQCPLCMLDLPEGNNIPPLLYDAAEKVQDVHAPQVVPGKEMTKWFTVDAIAQFLREMKHQNNRMEVSEEEPVMCPAHEWWHNPTEVCIHCQLKIDPDWWTTQDFYNAPEKPKPSSHMPSLEMNTHRFLDKRYSMMPKGTTLTWEEIKSKTPEIIKNASSEVSKQIYILFKTLNKNAKIRLPSHVYVPNNDDRIVAVWFDPAGDAHQNISLSARSKNVYEWDQEKNLDPWLVSGGRIPDQHHPQYGTNIPQTGAKTIVTALKEVQRRLDIRTKALATYNDDDVGDDELANDEYYDEDDD